jgi:hypothetical protein
MNGLSQAHPLNVGMRSPDSELGRQLILQSSQAPLLRTSDPIASSGFCSVDALGAALTSRVTMKLANLLRAHEQ